jgi:hypothetical protein
MASRRGTSFPVVVAAFAVLLGHGARVGAAPEDAKQQAYTNPDMGISAQVPTGWKLVAESGARVTSWVRLATFHDSLTDGYAVLSARPRESSSLDDLLARVRADWDASKDRVSVSSVRKVMPVPPQTVGTVILDATFVHKPPAPPAKPGEPTPPPPTPTTYRLQATYFLGADHEYLLRAQGQQTHWSRLRAPLTLLRDSVKLKGAQSEGPQGQGVFRDDGRGFHCKYPENYTVVVPQRPNHLVQFEGLAERDAALGVYAFRWSESMEKDAERLVAYYEQDMGGEASVRRIEVSGQEAMQVRAKASVGGQEKVFLLALLKREDTLFRVRASMPADAEADGERTFRRFLDHFRLK